MKTPIAVIISDVHATANGGAWANRPIVGDTKWALKQVASYVRKNKINRVFVLGDSFDSTLNRSAAIQIWGKFFDDLMVSTHVEYIQGNHDKEQVPWLSMFGGRAIHIDHQLREMECGRYYAFDYVGDDQLEEEIKKIPKGIQSLFTHQTWSEFLNFDGSHQGSLNRISKVDQVFTGDSHNCESKTVLTGMNETFKAVSVGSLTLQSIKENPQKYFVVLFSDGSWDNIKLKARKVIRSPYLGDPAELENFIKETQKQILSDAFNEPKTPTDCQKPIIHVNYYSNLAETEIAVKQGLADLGHLFFSMEDYEEKDRESKDTLVELFIKRTIHQVKPKDCVHLVLDIHRFPSSARLVSLLLNSNNPEREFSEWLTNQQKVKTKTRKKK